MKKHDRILPYFRKLDIMGIDRCTLLIRYTRLRRHEKYPNPRVHFENKTSTVYFRPRFLLSNGFRRLLLFSPVPCDTPRTPPHVGPSPFDMHPWGMTPVCVLLTRWHSHFTCETRNGGSRGPRAPRHSLYSVPSLPPMLSWDGSCCMGTRIRCNYPPLRLWNHDFTLLFEVHQAHCAR